MAIGRFAVGRFPVGRAPATNTIVLGAVNVTVSVQDLDLVASSTLQLEPVSISVNVQDLILSRTSTLVLEPISIAVSIQDLNLIYNRSIELEPVSISVDIQDLEFTDVLAPAQKTVLYKTKLQLCTATLRDMTRLGFVDDASQEDVNVICERYDTKLEEWRDRNIAYWDNTDLTTKEIPVEIFDQLVALMVNETEAMFGRRPKSQADKRAAEEYLLRRVRFHKDAAARLTQKAIYH